MCIKGVPFGDIRYGGYMNDSSVQDFKSSIFPGMKISIRLNGENDIFKGEFLWVNAVNDDNVTVVLVGHPYNEKYNINFSDIEDYSIIDELYSESDGVKKIYKFLAENGYYQYSGKRKDDSNILKKGYEVSDITVYFGNLEYDEKDLENLIYDENISKIKFSTGKDSYENFAVLEKYGYYRISSYCEYDDQVEFVKIYSVSNDSISLISRIEELFDKKLDDNSKADLQFIIDDAIITDEKVAESYWQSSTAYC